jgi:hypothetical protein
VSARDEIISRPFAPVKCTRTIRIAREQARSSPVCVAGFGGTRYRRIVEFDAQSVERQIKKATARISETEVWEECSFAPTADLVQGTLERIKGKRVAYKSLLDISEAPAARLSAFLSASAPIVDLESAIVMIPSNLIEKRSRNIYSDDPNAILLARFIAAFLLNGIRDAAGVIAAIRELQATARIGALDDVLTTAAAVADSSAQASIIAIGFLNNSVFIPFLRQTRRYPDWLGTHYHRSALIASAQTVAFVIDLLMPLALKQVDFVLDQRHELLFEWGTEMIDKFVTTPVFAHLDLDEIRTKDELPRELARQLGFGQKSKGLFKKPFIQVVAMQQNGGDGTFAAAVKKGGTVEQIFTEGVQKGCLPAWWMCLILSDLVDQYYFPYASVADPFRAKYILEAIVRILRDG